MAGFPLRSGAGLSNHRVGVESLSGAAVVVVDASVSFKGLRCTWHIRREGEIRREVEGYKGTGSFDGRITLGVGI
jgi:hypothetical protein